jgi:hypothetical protein
MDAPAKLPSLSDDCRDRRIKLLEAFCALEMDLAELLGPTAPKIFSQKIERLSRDQLAGLDAKSFIASRNLVAHAHIVCASRAGTAVSVWQVPHPERQLNARVMSRQELHEWEAAVSGDIEQLRRTMHIIPKSRA